MVKNDSSLSEIRCVPIRKSLIEIIERQLKTIDYEINVKSAIKNGENFVGIVQRVTFNAINDENNIGIGNNISTTSSRLIVKTAPEDQKRRDNFFSKPCFAREIYVYNQVLPNLKKFQESKGIIEDGFNNYPECFHTYDKEPDESLILEDMSLKGFSMLDRRRDKLTVDHVKLVMQTLGKWHAISFALKDQQPEKLSKIVSNLPEMFLTDAKMSGYFKALDEQLNEAVSNNNDEILRKKIKEFLKETQHKRVVDCANSNLAEPYAVICQGDCWTNNTLFNYDENQKPIEVCLLDWQLTRYASPVTDIVYYIFNSTTKEHRDRYYDTYLNVYHESLSNYLRRLGSDPEKLFPYDAMLDQLRKFGQFGLLMSNLLLPMITSEEERAPDLDELAVTLSNRRKNETHENVFISPTSKKLLYERLHGVITDMVRLNYI